MIRACFKRIDAIHQELRESRQPHDSAAVHAILRPEDEALQADKAAGDTSNTHSQNFSNTNESWPKKTYGSQEGNDQRSGLIYISNLLKSS
jgi:hypothetical protein